MRMRTICMSFIRRVLDDQRGQTMYLLVLGGMSLLLGMGGLTIDVGHAYVVRTQLQGSANAAAMAALPDLYDSNTTTTATSTAVTNLADQFSASAYGTKQYGANYNANLPTVTTTVTTPCLNALLISTTCKLSGNIPNAVRVVETAKVPTFFMKLFGVSSLQVSATATAAPSGPPRVPYNIAVILDATPSMVTPDANCGGVTEEQCAMNGIQEMLQKLNPCTVGGSCAYGDAATYVRVSFFSFPNVLSTTLSEDYSGSSAPTGEAYTLPVIPPLGSTSGYTPVAYTGTKSSSKTVWTGTYQITPHSADTTNIDAYGFTSDYYNLADTNAFNPSSILVKIFGNGVTNGYMKEPSSTYGSGGGVTYFASAIYAAQAALMAEQQLANKTVGQTTNNVIIFVSDGQANTTSGQFPAGDGATKVNNTAIGDYTMDTKTGAYPSNIDPCQQAMIAGQYAKSLGTKVIGIAYGAETNGCTDTNFVAVPTYAKFNVPLPSSASKIVPCMTIENIADSMDDFYAETSSVGCSTTGSNAPMSRLATIFDAVAVSLGAGPRLISNNLQ